MTAHCQVRNKKIIADSGILVLDALFSTLFRVSVRLQQRKTAVLSIWAGTCIWCLLPNRPGCQPIYSNGPGSALGHTPNLLTREIIAIRLGVRIRRPQINGSIIVPSADRGSGTGLVPFNPLCFRCENCVPVTAIALSAPCKGMFWSTVCSFFKVQQRVYSPYYISFTAGVFVINQEIILQDKMNTSSCPVDLRQYRTEKSMNVS